MEKAKTKSKKPSKKGFKFISKTLRLSPVRRAANFAIAFEEDFGLRFDSTSTKDPILLALMQKYDFKFEQLELPAVSGLLASQKVNVLSYNSNIADNDNKLIIANTDRAGRAHGSQYPLLAMEYDVATLTELRRIVMDRSRHFFLSARSNPDGNVTWSTCLSSLCELPGTAQKSWAVWPVPCATSEVGPNTTRISLIFNEKLEGGLGNVTYDYAYNRFLQTAVSDGTYKGKDATGLALHDIPEMKDLASFSKLGSQEILLRRIKLAEIAYVEYMTNNPSELVSYKEEKSKEILMANAKALSELCMHMANTADELQNVRMGLEAFNTEARTVYRCFTTTENMAYRLKEFHRLIGRLNEKYVYSDKLLADLLNASE
jgi:hypothetical protein